MMLEAFFEKFDLFANAPDAVAKMRELVLHLAVKGEIVGQDLRDEPASALLASARTEREKLVFARKIKARPSSPVEPDEQPFALPSTWTWARLSDVGYELGQKVPDRRFTYIDVGGVDSDKGCISERVEMLEPNEAPSRARKIVACGTVIYSTVRPYLRNIAIVDQEFDPEPIASTAFGILHPFKGINSRYLFYWLRSRPFTAYVEQGMKGMAYPAINDEKFYNGYIPIAPLAEQKRIVAKVDELMALCDRLEAQQQERETRHAALARASLARFADAPTPANLELLFHKSYSIPPADLRKSILTLAVQGKLVPQDPGDEPACKLVTRAQEERRRLWEAGILKRVKALEENSCADEVLALPGNWVACCLDDIALKITDGEHATPVREDHGHYLLSARNVRDGFIDVADVDYVGTEEFERIRKRCDPNAGDILLSCSGSVGRVAVVDADNKYAMVRSAALIKHSQANVDSHYLSLALRSPYLQSQIERSSKQSAQANLFIEPIRRLVVHIPPLAEQRWIVAKVDELMALVDVLETQLATARTTAEKLMEAVVAELTTQD